MTNSKIALRPVLLITWEAVKSRMSRVSALIKPSWTTPANVFRRIVVLLIKKLPKLPLRTYATQLRVSFLFFFLLDFSEISLTYFVFFFFFSYLFCRSPAPLASPAYPPRLLLPTIQPLPLFLRPTALQPLLFLPPPVQPPLQKRLLLLHTVSMV